MTIQKIPHPVGAAQEGEIMNQTKAQAIVAQLLTNAAALRYGTVAVSVKLHDGRVVSVSYTTTEQTLEPGIKKSKE